jgi:hypothetical protein
MNAYLVWTTALAMMLGTLSSLAHGRSEQMNQELNAKTPDWLSIGAPIKVEPSDTVAPDGVVFRPRSGGTTNSSNRVQIPARGIEIRVAYEVDWTGTGSSLSPDGTRLIVNSGPKSHLYEILSNGEFREIPLQLPHVTYDAGRKGYLREWSWADDQTLTGYAEIDDGAGHEILESRIYVYYLKERVLSRLDLSRLNLSIEDLVEVTKIGSDLNHLKLNLGNREFTVKADLRSPPVLATSEKRPEKSRENRPVLSSTSQVDLTSAAMNSKSKDKIPSSLWLWIIGIIILLITIVSALWKRQKS